MSCAKLLEESPRWGIPFHGAGCLCTKQSSRQQLHELLNFCMLVASELLGMSLQDGHDICHEVKSLCHPAICVSDSAAIRAHTSFPEVHSQGKHSPLGCSHNNGVS